MTRKVKANPRLETFVYFYILSAIHVISLIPFKQKRYKLPPKWQKEISIEISSSDFIELVKMLLLSNSNVLFFQSFLYFMSDNLI